MSGTGTYKDKALVALSPLARLYVGLVIVAGGVLIGWTVSRINVTQPFLFLGLLLLSFVASTAKIVLPLASGGSTLSPSYAINIVSLILLGTEHTVLIALASAWSQCTFNAKVHNPLYRTLFSMVSLGVTVLGTGLVYQWIRTGETDYVRSLLVPLVPATTVYFILNTLLVATAVALSSKQRLVTVWFQNFFWSAPSYFVGSAVAAVAVAAVEHGAYWWGALVALPVYVTYRSYRIFMGRIADEQRQVREISDVNLATAEALALAIEARDRTSHSDLRRIQIYAEGLGRSVGMPERDLRGLKTAALLHDIGNLAVPEHILSKPGPLTPEERHKVCIHPRVGADIVKDVPFPFPVAPLILAHHEHWDGSGYPQGLQQTGIPLGGRVLAVVDCFTALLSERPYRPAIPYHQAILILKQLAGTILDPLLVKKFLEVLPNLELTVLNNEAERRGLSSPEVGAAGGERLVSSALDDIAVAHREAQMLYEFAQALGSSRDVDDIMSLISSKLHDLVPFSTSALFLQDEEADHYACRCATGADADRLKACSGQNVQALIASLTSMVSAPTRRGLRLRSVLAAPLNSGGVPIGVLAVGHVDAGFYSNEHRRLLGLVAQQAASVLHNAMVFERTQEDSVTDPLTGLPNRRYMLSHLGQLVSQAQRHNRALSLMMLDLNDFKEINDTYGHAAGDRALCDVSRVLRSMIRPYDLCIRYGGDEFVVVLSECDSAQAGIKQRELQNAVTDIEFEARTGEFVALSVSVGAAVLPDDGETQEELLHTADIRMYRDKAGHRLQRAHSVDSEAAATV